MVRVGLIAVTVIDMSAAQDFYVDILGFKIKNDRHLPSFLELSDEDGDIRILLQAFGSEKTSKPVDSYPNGPGVAFNLSVDDIETEFNRIKDKVPVLTKGIEQSPGGPYFAIADPSGNVLEIIQFD